MEGARGRDRTDCQLGAESKTKALDEPDLSALWDEVEATK